MNHLSNKEQADLVKKFWRDYGRWISVAIVVGLLVGFGWRRYQGHHHQQQLRASTLYNNWLQGSVGSKDQSVPDAALLKQFQDHHSSSVYRSLLELQSVHGFLAKKQWVSAEKLLQAIIARNAHPAIADLARVRLARVLLIEHKAKQSLSALAAVKTESQLMKMLVAIERSKAYRQLGDQKQSEVAAANAHALAKVKGIQLGSYVFA